MSNAALWKLQGDIIGSTIYGADWSRTMTDKGATSNPGSVQVRIDRTLAKQAAERAAAELPKVIDPDIYAMRYDAARTQALALMMVG